MIWLSVVKKEKAFLSTFAYGYAMVFWVIPQIRLFCEIASRLQAWNLLDYISKHVPALKYLLSTG